MNLPGWKILGLPLSDTGNPCRSALPEPRPAVSARIVQGVAAFSSSDRTGEAGRRPASDEARKAGMAEISAPIAGAAVTQYLSAETLQRLR